MFGKKNELQVQVEQLPDVFEDNGLALVKIEDDKVINRIISAVPQLAQAGVNVGAVAEGMQAAMSQMGGGGNVTVNVTLQGDARRIFEVVKNENNSRVMQTGKAQLLT